MYVEGDADSAVAQHIAACPACRANAANLAQQQAALGTLLYRSTCPTPEELRDYEWALLDRADAGNVGIHLARCPHCTRELFVLRDYLAEAPATAVNVGGQLRLLVARLLNPTAPLSPATLLPAGRRGTEPTLSLYQVDGWQIGLEVGEDPVSGQKQLRGIITQNQLTSEEPENLLVHLWRDGELVATAVVDPLLGDFQFTQLPPTAATNGDQPNLYELIISAQQTKVRVPALQLGD